MGSFANSLFTILLGWLQSAVSAVWTAFTSEKGNSLFTWIGKHWIFLAAILCVIGLGADLCVYIFRWKPFRTWKSFFFQKNQSDSGQIRSKIPGQSAYRSFSAAGTAEKDERRPDPVQQSEEPGYEPDLSRWTSEQEQVFMNTEESIRGETTTATVTNAGYVVPADSPYRRPAEGGPSRQLQKAYDNTYIQEEGSASGPVITRRRRRVNISELFSDPEEELRLFDAPQHIIDSKKAYHEPVYPRGWKKGGENGNA